MKIDDIFVAILWWALVLILLLIGGKTVHDLIFSFGRNVKF